MLESTLVERIERHFEGGPLKVFREVPFLHRRIDLVAFDESRDRVITIEAKIKNWRVAVRQAQICLLCSDEVYMAIPEESLKRVNKALLTAQGIGLIVVGDDVEVLLKPGYSHLKHSFHSDWMLSLLREMTACERDQ